MTGAPGEALIIGGGLAGSMVALELAAAGRTPVLLERSLGPHDVVCGEFLSSEAIHYLQRHHVDLPALGAVRIQYVRLALQGRVIQNELPFAAYSLTRRVLDGEMLRLAVAAGVDVRRGCHVDALDTDGHAWTARTRSGQVFRASDVFLATGKHDLRGWPRSAGTHQGLVAFKMYFTLAERQRAALGNAVELILFPGGYAGLQPVEGGRVNLCLLIAAKRLLQMGSTWAALLAHLRRHSPHLAERLHEADALLEAPLAAAQIPYGYMLAAGAERPWMLGDQSAVIPSFCGDGMAIALHSGALAAQSYLRGATAAMYAAQLRHQLGLRVAIAARLSQGLVGWPGVAQIVRAVPGLLSRIARMTRIPDSALLQDEQWPREQA